MHDARGVTIMARLLLIGGVFLGCGKKETTPCQKAMDTAIDQMMGSGTEIPAAVRDQWRHCKNKLKAALTQQCSDEKWSPDVIACFNDKAKQPGDCFKMLSSDHNANSLTTIERVSIECQRDRAASSKNSGSAPQLTVEAQSTALLGVVKVIIKNRDTFDWHNVTVCVNDQWCAKDDSHAGAPSTNRVIKAGEEWALNWFMQSSIAYREAVRAGQIPGRGTISDFVDDQGSQNKVNQPINSVAVQADEGRWRQAY